MNEDKAEADALVQILKTGGDLRAPYRCPRCSTLYWTQRTCSGGFAPHVAVPVIARDS